MKQLVQYMVLGLSMKLSFLSVQLTQMSLILVIFPLNVCSQLQIPYISIGIKSNTLSPYEGSPSSQFPCFCQWHPISGFLVILIAGMG